jgi:bifunctional DNA-binding transcriptional regulator/antitoxin component of YhaV-PrlF toxin-antitoxin module
MKSVVSVDDVGRLVLPKRVREALGVFGRSVITIEVVGDKAELSVPPPPKTEVRKKEGRTVFCGPLPEDWDSGDAVSRMRDLRIRR